MSKNEIIKTEDLKTLTAEQLAEFAIKVVETLPGYIDGSCPSKARHCLSVATNTNYGDTEPERCIGIAKETAKVASNIFEPIKECLLRAAQWAALTAAGAKTYPDIARTRDCALTASQFALRTTMGKSYIVFPFEGVIANQEINTEALEAEIAKQWDILENIKSK